MNPSEDIRSITYLKENAAKALQMVNETGRPLYITQSGKTKAVVQDPKSYHSMTQALANLKLLAMGEKDISLGKTKSQEAVFADLEESLRSKK